MLFIQYPQPNAINLTAFPFKSPFGKGGFRGILNRYDKSPPTPLYQRGECGLKLMILTRNLQPVSFSIDNQQATIQRPATRNG